MRSLLSYLIIIGFFSCRCDCSCTKNIIYKRSIIRLKSNDSIVDSISFRRYANYSDRTNYDSIFEAFYRRYSINQSIYLYSYTNTIYKLDSAKGLKCGDTKNLIADSFQCECAI